MISYQSIVDKIIAFYDNHLQVKKVGSDFKEQMVNFATKDEKYPLVYVVPTVLPTAIEPVISWSSTVYGIPIGLDPDPIKAINPNAEVMIVAEDINQITWLNGTTPIPANEILAKQQELIAEYNAKQYQRE